MKLLEKFRWLLTEKPWPGTAEVSAKSWLALCSWEIRPESAMPDDA
jgi:hypothetical protein